MSKPDKRTGVQKAHDARKSMTPDEKKRREAVKARYITWIATPLTKRAPKNRTAFANLENVSYHTLRNWERTDKFRREVDRLRRGSVEDHLPEILDALIEGAKSGSFQHIRLVLEFVQMTDPKVLERNRLMDEADALVEQMNEKGADPMDMDDDELLEEFESLMARMKDRDEPDAP